MKTMATFKSSAFNTSEPREYFINPTCFGDDVAKWLIEQLNSKGYHIADAPGQEDFGWYIIFTVSGVKHCFVIGLRPGAKEGENVWLGWLERHCGPVVSLLGGRQRGIRPEAGRALHEILSNSPQIRDVRWHFQSDFDSGREQLGTSTP